MEHLMEIMTTGTETFCIVLLLNTFFERKYTSYRFFFPLSAAFLFYLWLPLNTILATSFVTKLFISILIWLVFSQIFYTGALPFHLFLLCSFFIILSGLDYFTLLGISYIFSFSFSDALSNSALYILGAFVSRTLLLLFSIIIYRLFKAKTSMILSSSTWIALLLFPVFSILLFGVTIEIAMAQNKISFNLILSGICAMRIRPAPHEAERFTYGLHPLRRCCKPEQNILLPIHPFTAPAVMPEMICFCARK